MAFLGIKGNAASSQYLAVEKAARENVLLFAAKADAKSEVLRWSPFLCHASRFWANRLFELDLMTGTPVSSLAVDWESTERGRVWSFLIRNDVRFHDGQSMTTNDVLSSLRRNLPAIFKEKFGTTENISTLQGHGNILVISLKQPISDLPQILSDRRLIIEPCQSPIPRSSMLGTGRYKLTAPPTSHYLEFEASGDSWEANFVIADRIVLFAVHDEVTRLEVLKSERFHYLEDFD